MQFSVQPNISKKWWVIDAKTDQDLLPPAPFPPKNSKSVETKQQTVSLGMDMQLEWLTLEDFQKHLDGEDENHLPGEAVSSSE